MSSGNLSYRVKTIVLSAGAASAATAVESPAVDMQGFEGVRFIVVVGTSNAGNSIKVEQGPTSTPTDDLEGSKLAFDGTDKCAVTDVLRPTDRYVRVAVDRSGADTTIQAIIAELYGPRTEPVVQDASIQFEALVSPAVGTA